MTGNKAILDSNVIIDAIILATARILNAKLLTSNIIDFTNIDDKVIIIEPVKLN